MPIPGGAEQMNVIKLADRKRNEGGTNIKKRLFSILLCLAMVLTLLPTAAPAEFTTQGPSR